MAAIIENKEFRAVINEHGAELSSLVAKKNGYEYLWTGDAKYWGRQSPVLFPIEGKLKNDSYHFKGQNYHMTQHGFARDQDFTIVDKTVDSVVFELTQNSTTKEKYPFDFRLRLTYSIDNTGLMIGYSVYNPAQEELYFAIGAHPAFSVPLVAGEKYSDYELSFSPTKNRRRIPLQNSLTAPEKEYDETDSPLAITRELFKDDALIYNLHQEPTLITLQDTKKQHGIQINTMDAKYVGIWSTYPQEGQFVCIEPWWGLADPHDTDGDFTHKFAINQLAPQEEFTAGFKVTPF